MAGGTRMNTVNLAELIPEQGDMATIVNCGTHFEVVTRKIEVEGLRLTEEDIELLRAGQVCWH